MRSLPTKSLRLSRKFPFMRSLPTKSLQLSRKLPFMRSLPTKSLRLSRKFPFMRSLLTKSLRLLRKLPFMRSLRSIFLYIRTTILLLKTSLHTPAMMNRHMLPTSLFLRIRKNLQTNLHLLNIQLQKIHTQTTYPTL